MSLRPVSVVALVVFLLAACSPPPGPGTGGGGGSTGGGSATTGGGGGGAEACGPASCAGCCDGNTCITSPGNQSNQTCGGSTGQACANCLLSGLTCRSGVCVDPSTGGGGGTTGGGATGGGGGDDAGTVICSPSMAPTCLGPTMVRRCSATGTAWEDTACTLGRACVDGGSGATCQCVRGELGCFSNDVYEFNSCGDRLGLVADCLLTNEEACRVFDDGVRCSRPVTCTSDSNCANRDYCLDGLCVPDVCNSAPPGDRAFCNGETVMRCRPNGSGYEVVESCSGPDAGQVCLTLPTTPYADCRCLANARRGCSNTDIYSFDSCGVRGALVQFCTDPEVCTEGPTGPFCRRNTSCVVDENCLAGEFCGAGACTPRVCTPGAQRCVGAQAQRCDARGTSWEVKDDCLGGESCVLTTGVAQCQCAANARQGCVGNQVFQFDACGAQGAGVMTCGAMQVCAESGATASCVAAPPAMSCLSDASCGAGNVCLDDVCALRVCAPSQSFCAAGSVRLCDARGATSTFVTECTAGASCTQDANGARCGCVANARQGCADGDVYQFDSCGQRGQLVTDCGAGTCVANGAGALCALPPADAGMSGVDAGAGCTPRARTDCWLGDLWSFDSCGHLEGVVEDCPGAVTCNTIGGPAACRSSVADAGSPFWSRACPLVQDVENPTVLDADCRCFINRAPTSGIPQCVGLQYVPTSTRFGAGPSLRSLPQAHFNGGVVVGREVMVGADWSSSTHPVQGLVMAVHLDTGARRIISGAYEDPMTGFAQTGSGPAFAKVIDVKAGSGGALFALSVPTTSASLEIVRVDPSTGARTLVWRGRDPAFGQCASGDPARPNGVTYHERVFELDATGGFYLAFRGAGPYSEGVGLVRISADGASCSFVTRSGAGALNTWAGSDVGGGFTVDRGYYSGLVQRQGQLYVLNDVLLSLFRIDPATGARTRISSASTSTGVVGAGPVNLGGIGQRWLTWDATRNLLWATGVQSYRALTAVDLATGDRTEATCRSTNASVPWRNTCLGGVLEGGYQNFGGFWVDPANGDPIVVHENHSLVRVDLRNGNSVRFSQ